MRGLNRRQFTGSVGAGLLLAPMLSMLKKHPAHAAAAKPAKRILFFCTMGTHTDLWSPKATGESAFTFSDMLKPLEAVKGNIVLVEGMPASNPADGHGSPEGLCARGNGYYPVNNVGQKKVSADEFIAQALIKAGITRPIPSLLLGADTSTSGAQTMLWKNDQAASIIASPSSAYSTAFGGAMPTGGTKPDALLARRKSILDAITQDINDVKKLAGANEQAKLDLHLDSIRQLETKLSATSGGGAACTMTGSKPTDASGQFPGCANVLLHMDTIVNAFACDITRVAALQLGTDQQFQVDIPGLQGEQHNGFLHGSAVDFSKLIKFEQWMATQFAALVTAMKSRPAPDDMNKTLLDDTLIVWARDMGEAATTHNMMSMRYVLAGGSYLKTNPNGRYLDLRSASNTNGANRHERVLLNCLEAMGVTSFAGFGDPGLGTKTPLGNIAAT